MKKILLSLLIITLTLSLFGCKDKKDYLLKEGQTTITVAASITPHAEILEVAKEILKEEGYTLKIKTFTDYILPNTALEAGDVDANFFQHTPYLEDFNQKNHTHLVSIGKIHYEPFGIYAGKTKSLEDLPDKAKIAIPNDGTNEARALKLLEAQGLITLKKTDSATLTKLDIESNPHEYEIIEMAAPTIARSLQDVHIGIINGNNALNAGLKITQALAIEDKTSETAQLYANILVVREGNETHPAILALYKALTSDKVRDYINQTYENQFIPIF